MQTVAVGLTIVLILAVFIAFLRTRTPIRALLRSGLLGLSALFGVHMLGAYTGVATGFGWFTVGGATLFGIPGVATMFLMNGIFH